MLTLNQLTQMDRDGLITVDSPFTPDEIARAASATDRVFADKPEGFSADIFEPDLLHLIFHPYVESVASQMLRTDQIGLRGVAVRKTAPRQDNRSGLEGEHADIRYSLHDWQASPRRVLCTLLIWLTDVTENRAPFMFRPGTHRQLAAMYQGFPTVANHSLDKLPKLDYPPNIPVLANAGQVSVGSSGVIHSGSFNRDTQARKVIFLQYQARNVPAVKFNDAHQPSMDAYSAKIRPLLPENRHHLLWIGSGG
jgi:hypothetical protein